jgi:hypothetical protein
MNSILPKFDKYTIYARLFPAIIAAAPMIALAWVLIATKEVRLVQAIAGIALAVLLMVFADVARRRGKAIEPTLISQMGGLPSTTMLRHSDTSFDAATKLRIHAFLADKLSEPAPTPEFEMAGPDGADAFYKRAGVWLRENTRNKKKFDILFNENITYGYRRNLYALKWPALVLNALIVIGCAAYLLHPWTQVASVNVLPVFVIAFLHAAYLAAFSTRSAVEEASRIYARQLLLSTESAELRKTEAAPKSRARKNAKGHINLRTSDSSS